MKETAIIVRLVLGLFKAVDVLVKKAEITRSI